MEPRIHVNARDYDTRRHMPVSLYEDIRTMDEPHPRLTYAVMILVGVLFWTAVVCAVFA